MRLFFFLISFTLAFQQYCRCEYNEQLEIFLLSNCNACTTQFCLDNFKATFNETTDSLAITCFQMESTKESMIVYTFIALVLGLLAFALFKLHKSNEST